MKNFDATYSNQDPTWIYNNSTNLYAVTLRDTVKDIFSLKNDEVEVKEEKKEEGKKDDAKKDEKKDESKKDEKSDVKKEDKSIKIDFNNLESRTTLIKKLGIASGMYAAEGKVFYISFSGADGWNGEGGTLWQFDLDKREHKEVTKGVNQFRLSADGKKILVQTPDRSYSIIDAAPGAKVADGKLKFADMNATVDPKLEWQQIFNDAWRIERDFLMIPACTDSTGRK